MRTLHRKVLIEKDPKSLSFNKKTSLIGEFDLEALVHLVARDNNSPNSTSSPLPGGRRWEVWISVLPVLSDTRSGRSPADEHIRPSRPAEGQLASVY